MEPIVQRALVGHFNDHHARLCAKMLSHIDGLTATITELTEEIDTEIQPFHARQRLSTIPGVSCRVAEVIAETAPGGSGYNRQGALRCPTASWKSPIHQGMVSGTP